MNIRILPGRQRLKNILKDKDNKRFSEKGSRLFFLNLLSKICKKAVWTLDKNDK
jgi:hypothetical protein